nr:L,D-transpeptidase [Sphingomonas sp. GM_Shp_2]
MLLAAPAAALAQRIPLEAGPIERLKPGKYLWAPQIAPDGPVTMIVSLATQRTYVYRNGVPIGVSTVSTGSKGHETPTGVFTILQKEVDHHSNLYANAPMPFMQRLTWDGIALHAGKLPGYPASHGCVRLPLAFAKLLYGVTRPGLTVVITDDALAPEVAPGATRSAPELAGDAQAQAYSWRPERAPSGPVSIVVSGQEQRLVVLRNGVEIGATPVALDAPVTTTAAYTLRAIDAEGLHWTRLPLPGLDTAVGEEIGDSERTRGRVPEAFERAVRGVLRPGATLLVTRQSLASSGTGTRLRLIEVQPPR